jgi:hypothetical protein
MNLPVLWEGAGLVNFDGVVWFRKKIALPPTWANNDLVLELVIGAFGAAAACVVDERHADEE